MRYRIITNGSNYRIQSWRWYLPFWQTMIHYVGFNLYTYTEFATIKETNDYIRELKSRKYYKAVDYPKKRCKHCNAWFKPKTKISSYCKRTHTPGARKAKKRQKLAAAYKQKISRHFSWQIALIYANRPNGHHVDHIIPINGKDVCGLHVPWNMQYLTAEENIKKSNSVITSSIEEK